MKVLGVVGLGRGGDAAVLAEETRKAVVTRAATRLVVHVGALGAALNGARP